MTIGIFNTNRLLVLDLLPDDWGQRIADRFEGNIPTIFPDEAEIYAGTDKECIETLEKYGLYSKEIKALMEGE